MTFMLKILYIREHIDNFWEKNSCLSKIIIYMFSDIQNFQQTELSFNLSTVCWLNKILVPAIFQAFFLSTSLCISKECYPTPPERRLWVSAGSGVLLTSSMGLRSGLIAGHSMVRILNLLRTSIVRSAVCPLVLSCCRGKSGPIPLCCYNDITTDQD